MSDKKERQNKTDNRRTLSDSARDIIRMEAPEPWPDPPPRKEEKKNQDSKD